MILIRNLETGESKYVEPRNGRITIRYPWRFVDTVANIEYSYRYCTNCKENGMYETS